MTTLMVQSLAVADTVVTVAATSTGLQRWVDLMTSIASIVIALALIAIAVPLIPAAWNSIRRMEYGSVAHALLIQKIACRLLPRSVDRVR